GIGACSEKGGGPLPAADLAGYRTGIRPPLSTTFAGREILGQSGWTQGPVLMQALRMLEGFDLRAMGHNSSQYVHVIAEALKLAFADRERYYGDSPAVPLSELLSPEYLRERATLIRPDTAMHEAPLPGDLSRVMGSARRPDSGRPGSGPA